MVAAARQRGLEMIESGMHDFAILRQFDPVFAIAVLHRTTVIEAVIQTMREHLQPGCRFARKFGCFGNAAAFTVAV